MEISGQGRAAELANYLFGVQESDRAAEKKPAAQGTTRDRVELSGAAQDLQRIKALVTRADDGARAERVAQLEEAIRSGTYHVSAQTVADALIRHTLTDAVL